MTIDFGCPYCDSHGIIVDGSVVYGPTYQDQFDLLICHNFPQCDSYVGVHKDTGLPKGSIANAELRNWRKKAHAAFDPLWKGKHRKYRSNAYMNLAEAMQITLSECHIAMFSIDECKACIDACEGALLEKCND